MKDPSGPFTVELLEFEYVRVYFHTANVIHPVSHRLKGDFVGWTVVRKQAYLDVKEGPMAPAPNVLQLICNTAGVTVTIRVEALRLPAT